MSDVGFKSMPSVSLQIIITGNAFIAQIPGQFASFVGKADDFWLAFLLEIATWSAILAVH